MDKHDWLKILLRAICYKRVLIVVFYEDIEEQTVVKK